MRNGESESDRSSEQSLLYAAFPKEMNRDPKEMN
jgi:hypothetical protein